MWSSHYMTMSPNCKSLVGELLDIVIWKSKGYTSTKLGRSIVLRNTLGKLFRWIRSSGQHLSYVTLVKQMAYFSTVVLYSNLVSSIKRSPVRVFHLGFQQIQKYSVAFMIIRTVLYLWSFLCEISQWKDRNTCCIAGVLWYFKFVTDLNFRWFNIGLNIKNWRCCWSFWFLK